MIDCKSSFFVIIFLFFIFNSNFIYSQLAVDPNGRCEKYIGNTVCDKFLFNTESIFVNSSTTQIETNATVSGLVALLQLLPASCNVASTFRLICNQNFQPCVGVPTLDNSTEIALNIRPCRDSCEFGNEICSTSSILPCDGTFTDPTSILKFPITSNVYNLTYLNGPNNYSLTCLDIDTMTAGDNIGNYVPNNDTIDSTTCVSPLIYRKSVDREGDLKLGFQYLTNTSDCLVPCPIPFFTEKQWYQFKDLTSSTGIISFICVFFNVLTYGFLNKKHDRHTIGILCLSFSLWCCMLSDLIVASSEDYSLVCPEPGRFARQHDKKCTANGIIFQWGAVSTTMFWSAMCIDLYLVIKKLQIPLNAVKYFVSGIFALTVLFTFLPLGWDQYGYGFGGVGCWILDNSWQNGVFWIVLSVVMFIGAVSICLIIYEVVSIFRNVGRSVKSMILANARLFGIVFFIFIEYVYLFVYHFWVERNTDKFYQNITDYVICVQSSGTDDNNCPRPDAVPFSTQFIFLLFLRLLGIEVLIFYGINARTKKIWLESDLVNSKYFKAIRSKISTFSRGPTSSTRNVNSNLSNFNNSKSNFDSSQFSVEPSTNTKGMNDIDDDL